MARPFFGFCFSTLETWGLAREATGGRWASEAEGRDSKSIRSEDPGSRVSSSESEGSAVPCIDMDNSDVEAASEMGREQLLAERVDKIQGRLKQWGEGEGLGE